MLFNSLQHLKKPYLSLLLLSAGLFAVLRFPYRGYVYSHSLYDFHVADTAPNFIAVIMFVFFKKINPAQNTNFFICSCAFLGATIYELFIQQYIYTATTDWRDIVASLLASILSYFLCQYLDSRDTECFNN